MASSSSSLSYLRRGHGTLAGPSPRRSADPTAGAAGPAAASGGASGGAGTGGAAAAAHGASQALGGKKTGENDGGRGFGT